MAGELGREAVDRGFDLLLAAGGDGTVNEILNGIVGSRIVFGQLPAGTANVLAMEVGLSGRPDRAATELLDAVSCSWRASVWTRASSANSISI